MRQTIKLTICIAALFCVRSAYADTVNTGIQAYQSGEYSRALDILMSLENQDHPAAQNLIGNAFNTGSGVTQSNEIAARWWTKAANQNYAPAQVSLSYLYFTGNGVKQSYPKFFDWAGRAAAQNNPQALSYLGQAFYYGHGVPKNHQQARLYFERAYDQGSFGGLTLLAEMYEHGLGGPASHDEAAYLYQQDYTRNKDASALSALEQLSTNGSLYARLVLSDLSTKDQTERHTDRVVLAKAGLLAAQCRVGIDFSMGLGTIPDHAAAIFWLEKAKARGSLCAARHIATLNEQGIGMIKDLNHAASLHAEAIAMAEHPRFGDVERPEKHIIDSKAALKRLTQKQANITAEVLPD